ncbi:uncharacterized protein LOC110369804 [Helicoverpa armigera]|uniref:uncharacterized protein LOC110369804 n=1 Tax=Helicoverpa armigera TaxID=29058 RepID=UPI0030835014
MSLHEIRIGMFALWILLLTSSVVTLAADITITTEANITTLYPVSRTAFNKTIHRNEIHSRHSDTDTKSSDTNVALNDTDSNSNNTETKDNKTEVITKSAPQSWKIESSYVESNLTEDGNTTEAKEGKDKKELLKDFKPSQHLGSFFDDYSSEVIKTPVFGPIAKKPASGFISSPKEEYSHHTTFNKIPKEIYYTHQEFPYKFEDTSYTKTRGNWQDSLDSKPTVEVPVKVPAGGLYKAPVTFEDKPHNDEEFSGLSFHEDEKHSVKKHVNPWKNLLRLVTAFIPVGLIISALTPSVITIHNVDDNLQPSLPYRRSNSGVSDIPPISERCRRRLLCELHSERNYVPPNTLPRRSMKHCYKIHCEDTEALWRTLRWLFTYNQADDHRGRLIT